MVWLPLVLVGLLSALWDHGPLAGIGVLLSVAWWQRSLQLVAAVLVFALAAVYGMPPFPTVVAVAAAVVLAAHDLHARRPGVWFPLLATGLGLFTTSLGMVWLRSVPWPARSPEEDSRTITQITTISWWPDDGSYVDVGVLVAAFAVASGLGIWALQARSPVVAVTAAGYLVAAWLLLPEPQPAMGWTDREQYADPFTQPHPELVLLIGAAVAFTTMRAPDEKRPVWLPLIVVGLSGPFWEYGSLVGVAVLVVVAGYLRSLRLAAATAVYAVAALVEPQPFPAVVAVAAALLLAAHDLHARRPGVWFPLLATGLGVLTAKLADYWVVGPPPVTYGSRSTTGYYATLQSDEMTSAVAIAFDPSADLHFTRAVAVAVAVGLAVWAWRAKNFLVVATAAGYLAAAWHLAPEYPEVVVLAGAAVAFTRDSRARTR
ncbi:hypothetical protein ACQPZF_18015 [Actinosynnema sp. CS-041913]|uniref:hypothetical protein n=1 Tax=Actinosynnema sp. CS-041913 TaxID=3239917 RepID=UPI003D8B3F39